MNVLVLIEDEMMTHQIQKILPKSPQIRYCKNILQVYDLLKKDFIQVLIIENELSQISGIDFIKTLSYRPTIILLHQGNNLVAGEKTHCFEKQHIEVSKTQIRQIIKESQKLQQKKQREEAPSLSNSNFIFVKSDGLLVKINFSELKFVEGLKDYIVLSTKKKKVITLKTMKKIHESLPEDIFVRIHKSYIVNLNAIDTISKKTVLVGDKTIPIGNRYKVDFFERIKQLGL